MRALLATAGRRLPVSREVACFVAVGLACTAIYAALYSALRAGGAGDLESNALALGLTMGINFLANRHLTFAAGGGSLGRQLAGYAVAYALGLGASSVALAALVALLRHPHGVTDTGAALLAGLAATAVRYVLMSRWVFAAGAPAGQRA